MQNVRNVFVTFLFLMSFCAYACSCTSIETSLQSHSATQVDVSFKAVKSATVQHGIVPKNGFSQGKIQFKHSLIKQNTVASVPLLNAPIKHLNQKSPASKGPRKIKEGEHVTPALNRNSYLLSEYQRQPLYQLEIEFNPPCPPTQKSTLSLVKNDYRPWFLSSPGNPARISGWKESNSLYSGSITYHS